MASRRTARDIVAKGETKETTRRWSSTIKAQWVKIESALAANKPTDAVSDPVSMTDLTKGKAVETYVGRSVRVTEIRCPSTEEPIQVGAAEFVEQLRKSLLLSSKAKTVHFKLFGINSEGNLLNTRQRLTAQGSQKGKPVRFAAVVDAKWSIPSEASKKQSPRLVEYQMGKLERCELLNESWLFEDIAADVLRGNAAWEEQLQFGMNTWADHIDRSLSPDFLGYHGVAIGDVDADGLEDVYFCQPGGLPNLLFRKQADGSLVDFSRSAGVDLLDNSTGALFLDLDNDGDKDLAIATRSAFLVMENNGEGKFAARAGFGNIQKGFSPTAADYDLDGDLDLLVLRYGGSDRKTGDFPTPHPFHDARNGGANVLLQNQGNFKFVDVTEQCGLGQENHRFSFAAAWEDYDNDGDLDLYIANDFGPNQLFRQEDGKFEDESVRSQTQDWGFGMSAAWADYNRDGNMDLYVSSMFSGAGNQIVAKADFNPTMGERTRKKYLKMVRGNTLMQNVGDGQFLDVTNPMAEGFGGWAWGASFGDWNNDGWQDLYVANGYISQPNKDDL